MLALCSSSCKENKSDKKSSSNSTTRYAKGFDIEYNSTNYHKLTLYNPWNNYSPDKVFYIVNSDTVKTPMDGIKLITPIKSVMINSATYLGFLELLDELPSVVGSCNVNYIYNPTIIDGVKNLRVKDLGDSFNLNQEELMMLQPQLILSTAYSGDKREGELFERMNINALFATEWQEPTLLGRAEWIKCIGLLYNKIELADSIFNKIESNYLEAIQLTEEIKNKPSVLSGQDFRGTWSMPSGSSYSAELFRKAKLDYYYQENKDFQGSIPSSIEEALVYFHEADLWLFTQENSLDQLEQANDKYKLFKAFREANVYNTNKRVNEFGGNDYWEMGVARPDLLLKDVIKAAHPELLPSYEFTFMNKLK